MRAAVWLLSASDGAKLEHIKAHLIIELSPSEQRNAHKRTDRTITTFASKFLSSTYGDGVGLGDCSSSNLLE